MNQSQEQKKSSLKTMDQILEEMSSEAGKTTLLMECPHVKGGFLIYVSPKEQNPFKGLMSALLDIGARRGGDLGPNINIYRYDGRLVVPGREWYWCVKDDNGDIVIDGFAPTEEEARSQITLHFSKG